MIFVLGLNFSRLILTKKRTSTVRIDATNVHGIFTNPSGYNTIEESHRSTNFLNYKMSKMR